MKAVSPLFSFKHFTPDTFCDRELWTNCISGDGGDSLFIDCVPGVTGYTGERQSVKKELLSLCHRREPVFSRETATLWQEVNVQTHCQRPWCQCAPLSCEARAKWPLGQSPGPSLRLLKLPLLTHTHRPGLHSLSLRS